MMEPRVPADLEFGLEAYGVELRVLFLESSGYSAGVFRPGVRGAGRDGDRAGP